MIKAKGNLSLKNKTLSGWDRFENRKVFHEIIYRINF